MIKVINVISDTNIGGAGRLLLSFLDNYDREAFDLEVFLPPNSLLKPEIVKRDVKLTEVDGISDQSLSKQGIVNLRRLFKEKKPDIVHSHAVMSARIAAKGLRGIKIVSTRHSVFDQPEKEKSFPKKQLNGFMNNFFGDSIIAVSPAAKENIVEIGADPQKIRVIMNGVDETRRLSEEEKKSVREKYKLSPDDFVVAIIARLTEVKGHSYVLNAARILRTFDDKVKILIAGTGEFEESLKKKAREFDLSNVIFTGFVKEIYEIENIMDLQINASYGTEATSLSLLEGMCLGVPAVVSDFGGNPFVIETDVNGVVIPKKDEVELAKKILLLKNDRELYEKLKAGAVKRYQERFTSKAMTREIEDEYQRLCADAAQKPNL